MKTIFSIVFFQFVILNLTAQNSPGLKTFITPSPTAASLGKFGEIPVGLYTGILNINIPIYTVKGRELELPISLSYHAGGHRVEEIASWVGLGWNLNAGGVITRTIRGGFPDFASVGYFDRVASITSLAKKYLTNLSPTSSYFSGMGNADAADKNTLDALLDQTYDSEPDIYSFNFGKYSGKFFIAENGQIVISPAQALKIEYGYNTAVAPQDLARWIFTTPDGVKYIFGNSLDGQSIAVEKNDNGATTGNTITSWYLLQMISPNNETITLDYTNISYNYLSKAGEVINQIVDETTNPPPPLPFFDKKVVTNYMTMPKLRSITFTKGKIIFDAITNRNDLPGDTYLSTITIFSNADFINPFKKFNLSYSNGTRLRLENLEEISPATSSVAAKYRFEYSTQSLPDPSPYGTAINSQDLWGYYNGVPNNVLPQSFSIQTSPYGTVNIYGADRHSDETFMQAEVLNKIIYPTGGYTQFDYEANRVYSSNTDNSIPPAPVGKGASITYFPGQTIEKTFTVQYPDPNTNDVTVSVLSRQMVQGCPISPSSGYSQCYTAWVEGINGTQFPPSYFRDGSSSINLPAGTYKMVGQGLHYPGQPDDNAIYLTLSWSEYPPQGGGAPMMVNKVIGGLRIKKIINYDGLNTTIKKYLYNKFSDNTISSGVLVNQPYHFANMFQLIGGDGGGGTVYAQIRSYPLIPLMPTQGSAIGYENVTELIGENGEGGKTEYTFTTANDFPDEIKEYRPYAPSCNFDWKRGQLLNNTFYKNNGGNFFPVKSVSNKYVFGTNQQTGYGLTVDRDVKTIPGGTYTIVIGPEHYYVSGYKTASEFYYLESETTRLYDQNIPSNYTETINNYNYDLTKGHYQLIRQETKNSKGENFVTNLKYPLDYTITGTTSSVVAQGIQNLQNNHIISPVIEQYTQKSNVDGSNTRTVSAVLNTYKSTAPLPDIIYSLESSVPVTNFVPATITASAFTKDNSYKPKVSFDIYDSKGGILQQHKTDDINHSYIWDFNNTYPIAEVTNAAVTDIFHTSFEDTEGNSAESDSKTGKKSRTGGYSKPLTNLTNGQYVLSYWQKSGSIWTLQTSTITVSGNAYTINLTGQVDEVRFYPSAAQMATYTYEPLIGITSQTDANNRSTYYEYDSFGRLSLVRDQDKNVIKKLDYKYQATPQQ